MSGRRRCAIYTRTSTEEGLGQDFNSLNAQSEACSAYIKSQVGEGWSLLGKPYEDGGYSGGSIDRPAFKRLLADIEAKRIDVVVVYKVDRLTRSLADFAKIMEVLDKAGASFVSVTQAFNTTTSMGRLTLNVLLSFAQFEREVTGERIRDKFAASKAKGMWMGGKPPLGYEPHGRSLTINETEADQVRLIFARFIALRSVITLEPELQQRGVIAKQWTSASGIAHGGHPITRGGLYTILSNPLYRGMIRHKGKFYDGQHEAIIDMDHAVLAATSRLLDREWKANEAEQDRMLAALQRVEVGARHMTLDLRVEAVSEVALLALPSTIAIERNDQTISVRGPIAMARPRNATTLIGANGVTLARIDDALVRAITRAKEWVSKLEAGEPRSIRELARMEKLCILHTAKLLPLAYLAPDLVELVLDGRQPPRLTLSSLIAEPLPETWAAQRARFAEFN